MDLHHIQDIVSQADLSNWDDPNTRDRLKRWVANFAENQFPAMNEVIVNCLREYEAEQSGQ